RCCRFRANCCDCRWASRTPTTCSKTCAVRWTRLKKPEGRALRVDVVGGGAGGARSFPIVADARLPQLGTRDAATDQGHPGAAGAVTPGVELCPGDRVRGGRVQREGGDHAGEERQHTSGTRTVRCAPSSHT